MTELDDAFDELAANAVAADIMAHGRPREESPEDRERRLAEWQAIRALNDEREQRRRAQHEAEQLVEQQRLAREARAAHARAATEHAQQRQRERDAGFERQRLERVEGQLAAARARAEHQQREMAKAAEAQSWDDLIAGMQRLNPLRAPTAEERLAAAEEALAAQAAAPDVLEGCRFPWR
jgi:dTMP kinase